VKLRLEPELIEKEPLTTAAFDTDLNVSFFKFNSFAYFIQINFFLVNLMIFKNIFSFKINQKFFNFKILRNNKNSPVCMLYL